MLYEFDQKWLPVPIEECEPDQGLLGCILLEQLEEHSQRFGISQETLDMCLSNSLLYRKGLQSLEKYSFSIIPLFDRDSGFDERDKIGILVTRNMCLIIIIKDGCHKVDKYFTELINRGWEKNQTARFLYTFLDELLERDAVLLENMDFHIARMEEKLVKERPPRDFHSEIFAMKRKLLLLRSYYEQLLEIGERMYGNDNGILAEKDREQFRTFTDRVRRFRDNVMFLKESLVEIREAYDSYVDLNLNAIMKFFTVSTTVFLPLTFMTGWYGMNFENMPELGWQYGYLLFFVISVVVCVIIMIYFKKKKYL
ncbi:MAG: hypothetical protein HFI75_04435 [Lachnospiraceae bacterium]|nr:hypothetical protein [Lachnospiraceae bacterium]